MFNEMQRFQLERVNRAFFSPRGKREEVDNKDELFHSLKLIIMRMSGVEYACATDPGSVDEWEQASKIASLLFVLDDGLFDSTMADAFRAETGAKVRLNPPEEEDYFTGTIEPLHADWEIHFD